MTPLKQLFLCVIGIFVWGAALLAARTPLTDPLPPIQKMEAQLDSLRMRHNHLLGESDLLAERIKLYRQKKDLNAREHSNLEKLLRRAQTLSSEISAAERGANDVLAAYQFLLDDRIESIETEMTALLSAGSTDRKDTAAYNRFEQLLVWKTELESRKKPLILSSEKGTRLTLAPDDSPRDLQMKGDILLDREQLYRNEIQRVDNRIESLKIEANVRRKVRQMASDMDLFNEDDELIARRSPARGIESASNYIDYWDNTANIGANTERKSTTFPDDPPASGESVIRLDSRSPEAIDAAVASLNQHRFRLQALADSLKSRSQIFYQEADRRRELLH